MSRRLDPPRGHEVVSLTIRVSADLYHALQKGKILERHAHDRARAEASPATERRRRRTRAEIREDGDTRPRHRRHPVTLATITKRLWRQWLRRQRIPITPVPAQAERAAVRTTHWRAAIIGALADREPLTVRALARLLDASPATLSRHTRRLLDVGDLVHDARDGLALARHLRQRIDARSPRPGR